jgi:hypothetical protein
MMIYLGDICKVFSDIPIPVQSAFLTKGMPNKVIIRIGPAVVRTDVPPGEARKISSVKSAVTMKTHLLRAEAGSKMAMKDLFISLSIRGFG